MVCDTMSFRIQDYWVSFFHKSLVGPQVFDARIRNEEDHVYLYCQCASSKNGSIVIFGVNLNPREVTFDLEGINVTTVHEYVLTPGFDAPNRMFAE